MTEGTPQGGPLSPLLSNIVLDDLDSELDKRGLKFVRYADDCNVYVRSERSAQRVFRGLTRFIEGKLKLKVNQGKTAFGSPDDRRTNRRIRTRMYGGVGGKARKGLPIPIQKVKRLG